MTEISNIKFNCTSRDSNCYSHSEKRTYHRHMVDGMLSLRSSTIAFLVQIWTPTEEMRLNTGFEANCFTCCCFEGDINSFVPYTLDFIGSNSEFSFIFVLSITQNINPFEQVYFSHYLYITMKTIYLFSLLILLSMITFNIFININITLRYRYLLFISFLYSQL